MTRRRVLLVDDHALIRAGLHALLQDFREVEVVGEAGNGADALRLIGELKPDVALMDISMPGLNGLEATRRAKKLYPRTRVLTLSMHTEKEYVRQALLAGSAGYLLKTSEPEELELAIATVGRGELWISPAVAKFVVDDAVSMGVARRDNPQDQLTARQREVLQLIAEGHSTKQIARKLQLSVKTIESHRSQIMERLDLHHVAGLVRYAVRAGIVPPEQ